jgi:HD-like signal output (HDOD) protein
MSAVQPPTLEAVCRRTLNLPCSPVVLPRLIAALQDEDSTAAEIEEIIRLDSALTVSTLRLANSAALSGGRPVATVNEAIMRLGSQEMFRLVALALVNRWETNCGSPPSGEPGDFSRHALCTAVAAERLAARSGGVDRQVAYTAGLICKVGRLALNHACAPWYAAIRELCASRRLCWAEAEREVLGYDQAEAGVSLLRSWLFPELLTLAIEYQAGPAAAPAVVRPLLAHLHAAQYMAVTMGPGVGEEGFLFAMDAVFLAEHGLTIAVIEGLMPELFQWVDARLGDKLSHGVLTL